MHYRKMPLLVTGTLQNKKEKPFYPQQIYYSKGFLRRKGEICNLDIFSEVKAHLTARQVAESYAILTSKRVEQQTYRSCMGLLKLAEKY